MPANVETDFVITRVFDAPRALVFAAWTDPAQLAAWWGPRVMRSRCTRDVRPGGAYRIVMRDTNAQRRVSDDRRPIARSSRPSSWSTRAISPATRRRGSTRCFPVPIASSRLVTFVAFEERGRREDARDGAHAATSGAVREAMLKIGMNEGWSESLDRLITRLADVPREITSQRTFAAPRELVWKVWTEPEHIAKWWGPTGFTSTISTR